MKLRDITDAIGGDDKLTLRRAFRALVVQPPAEEIEASSPGMLVVALNRICGALASDTAVMARETCDALALAAGSSYAEGAAAVKRSWQGISRRIVDGG